jgi:cullin-associated NEDD8-dissociated protein 1
LEAFILRCPSFIKSHLETIVNLCLEHITYDPNYAADDSQEEEDNNMDDDDDGDEGSDEDEFDEDDYDK